MKTSPCLLLAVLIGLGSSAADEPTVLYQRAQIEHAVSGTVAIAARYAIMLDLPAHDCAGGEFSCRHDQRYGQLYRIDFTLSELRQEDGVQLEDEGSGAGAIYIAADIERRQELEFDAALDAAIAELHGDSFRHPHAGWGIGRPPLGQQALLGPSNKSAWICMEHESTESVYRITPQLDGERVTGVTSATIGDESRESICEALRDGWGRESARSITTPYDIGALLRTEIDVSADWYPGSGTDSAFQLLPPEMEYEKIEIDPQSSGSAMGYDSDTGRYNMQRVENGEKITMSLGEFELLPPRPASAAWVTRWNISTYSQHFGVGAYERLIEQEQLWIVALPIVDPLIESTEIDLQDPGAARLAELTGDFDRAAQLDVSVLAEAFHSTIAGAMDEGDWMFVYCSPRQAPQYGIAGFFGRSEIRNGSSVCDAVARLFPSSAEGGRGPGRSEVRSSSP